MPGRIGLVFHTTFSCAAAWIASYSFGATTPRKLPTCTTFAPGMCAIELRVDADRDVRVVRVRRPGRAAAPRGRAASRAPGRCARTCSSRSPCPGCRRATTAFGSSSDRLVGRRTASTAPRPGCRLTFAHRDVEELAADELAVGDRLAAARDDALVDREARDRARRASSRPCRAAPAAAIAPTRGSSGPGPTSRSSRPRRRSRRRSRCRRAPPSALS